MAMKMELELDHKLKRTKSRNPERLGVFETLSGGRYKSGQKAGWRNSRVLAGTP
jgi:hypothetical protein